MCPALLAVTRSVWRYHKIPANFCQEPQDTKQCTRRRMSLIYCSATTGARTSFILLVTKKKILNLIVCSKHLNQFHYFTFNMLLQKSFSLFTRTCCPTPYRFVDKPSPSEFHAHWSLCLATALFLTDCPVIGWSSWSSLRAFSRSHQGFFRFVCDWLVAVLTSRPASWSETEAGLKSKLGWRERPWWDPRAADREGTDGPDTPLGPFSVSF